MLNILCGTIEATQSLNMVHFSTQVGHDDLRKSLPSSFLLRNTDSKDSLLENIMLEKVDTLSEENILADSVTWVHSKLLKDRASLVTFFLKKNYPNDHFPHLLRTAV